MNEITNQHVIDARALPPRNKHGTIFNAWHELPAGGGLLLINDHDPLPLYYQFACEHAGEFHWEYLERGPETWRVQIRKGAFADPGFVPVKKAVRAAEPGKPSATEPLLLDTRPIFARGETPCAAIEDAAGALGPGQPLVLLVPFEPVPLYAKFEKEGFSHQAEQTADGTWRVEFRRTG